MTTFKIDYKIGLEDSIEFMKFQVMSGKNPSIIDSISRWKKVWFIMLILALPLIYGLLFKSWFVYLVFLLLAIIIFGIMTYKDNLTRLWWRLNRKKYRKDVIAMYFKESELQKISRNLTVKDEQITIAGNNKTQTFSSDHIMLLTLDAPYLYLLSDNYDGTLIPLKYVSSEQRQWFAKRAVTS